MPAEGVVGILVFAVMVGSVLLCTWPDQVRSWRLGREQRRVRREIAERKHLALLEAQAGVSVAVEAEDCPECGKPYTAGAKFCAYCKHRRDVPPPPEQQVCDECGARTFPDAAYCPECGKVVNMRAWERLKAAERAAKRLVADDPAGHQPNGPHIDPNKVFAPGQIASGVVPPGWTPPQHPSVVTPPSRPNPFGNPALLEYVESDQKPPAGRPHVIVTSGTASGAASGAPAVYAEREPESHLADYSATLSTVGDIEQIGHPTPRVSLRFMNEITHIEQRFEAQVKLGQRDPVSYQARWTTPVQPHAGAALTWACPTCGGTCDKPAVTTSAPRAADTAWTSVDLFFATHRHLPERNLLALLRCRDCGRALPLNLGTYNLLIAWQADTDVTPDNHPIIARRFEALWDAQGRYHIERDGNGSRYALPAWRLLIDGEPVRRRNNAHRDNALYRHRR